MTIRQATEQDIPQMKEIFAHARAFMVKTGNPTQWGDDYPCDELIQEDINNADCFLCQENNEIVGTFVLRGGNDPTYEKIYDGAWSNNNPYATIHRIASLGKVKGIFEACMDFALRHYATIRIDTHRDNQPMQNAIRKAGFTYCGIIYCWDGSERLAFQYN